MLEFETDVLSGQMVANSRTTPFKTYWIDEGAWAYLYTVAGDKAGANISQPQPYHSVAEAVKAANAEEHKP